MRPAPTTHSRLVIADDSPEMRWLVRSAIGDEFATVLEASNGRELLWILLRTTFQVHDDLPLVITDYAMPGYDGLSVIDAWHDVHPDAPIILITAYPSDQVRQRAAALDAVLLAKPFSTAELRRLVDQMRGPRGN